MESGAGGGPVHGSDNNHDADPVGPKIKRVKEEEAQPPQAVAPTVATNQSSKLNQISKPPGVSGLKMNNHSSTSSSQTATSSTAGAKRVQQQHQAKKALVHRQMEPSEADLNFKRDMKWCGLIQQSRSGVEGANGAVQLEEGDVVVDSDGLTMSEEEQMMEDLEEEEVDEDSFTEDEDTLEELEEEESAEEVEEELEEEEDCCECAEVGAQCSFCDEKIEEILAYNERSLGIRQIPDHIEAYNQDREITLVGEEDGEITELTGGGPTRWNPSSGSQRFSNINTNRNWGGQHCHHGQSSSFHAEAVNRRAQQLDNEEGQQIGWADEVDPGIPLEVDENDIPSGLLIKDDGDIRRRKRSLPSPILSDQLENCHHQFRGVFTAEEEEEHQHYNMRIPEQPQESMLEEDVLLVPGVNECNVGNMEDILDCMKTFCGRSQQFKVVDNLEAALRRCRPGCRIFIGSGEHPISSLGILGNNGGEIYGPLSGCGQAVLSPRFSEHVWLNVMRSSNVNIQNITVLLDKVTFSPAGGSTSIGPGVGILVQGKLRLHNVIITAKLNDEAENPTRPITGIELTEHSSLQLQQSTIKHCSIGLITQNEAETEIYQTTITNCVIGFQSALIAKNYIQDLSIVQCNNYALMVDSEGQFGEGSVEDLKQEDSFFIESLKIKDCSTEVYFIGVDPPSSGSGPSGSGSGSGSDQSNGSFSKTK